jgi:hypothetical protein
MGKFATIFESQELSEDTWGVSTPLKKSGGYENGNRKATVHKDRDWGEYRVKHHVDGKHQKEADYHTDDKEEAHDHAKHWVSQAGKNESVEQLGEKDSEWSANQALAGEAPSTLPKAAKPEQHHVYVSSRGKKKSIAGPFRSKEEAEAHPARKFGDGVTTHDQVHA